MRMLRVFLPVAFTLLFLTGFDQAGPAAFQHSKDSRDTIPRYPDLYYECKISELNKTSPIELDFNPYVKAYIELYTIQRRQELAAIIGRSQIYFPIFDEALDRNALPLELKYLTIIESGLIPTAVSKSGAVGLWQFLIGTGSMFDLTINSYIDERRDPYKSTEAACKYLQYLYNTFHDWNLVLASYNGGPGETRKAIERSRGETDYWKIRHLLSDQAKNYVPAFVAMVYIMNHYADHNIVPVSPSYSYRQLDTLHIRYAVSFKQISGMIDLPVEHIRFLNPVYKRDYIPELDYPAILILPANKIVPYLHNEVNILGYYSEPVNYNMLVENAGNTDNRIKIIHVVEKGDFFHKIALKYGCTVENIKAWNDLDSLSLIPGQKLEIWVDKNFRIP
ncbi:MAG: transglycosylase SLT domain-containing protein [Bacteroidales bacterium]|nr:transglycosylase SLT domain-containing protein [Bacteroidales bacterium]